MDSTLAEGANPPDRIYRSFAFDITVAKGAVTAVSQNDKTDGGSTLAGGKLVGRPPADLDEGRLPEPGATSVAA